MKVVIIAEKIYITCVFLLWYTMTPFDLLTSGGLPHPPGEHGSGGITIVGVVLRQAVTGWGLNLGLRIV